MRRVAEGACADGRAKRAADTERKTDDKVSAEQSELERAKPD